MNFSTFLALVHNTSLLLAVALVFDLTVFRWRTGRTLLSQAAVGGMLGALGLAVMLTPWTFVPGIVFDTRSILIGLSGLFFGTIATTVVMLLTAAMRLWQGGAGALTGIAVILATGLIGMGWRRLRGKPVADLGDGELYLFGLAIHLVMLALMLTLPGGAGPRVLADISLPVLTIYPIGTALLGMMMVNRSRRERIGEALQQSESNLLEAQAIARLGRWELDLSGKRLRWSDSVYEIFELDRSEFGASYEVFLTAIHPEDRAIVDRTFNESLVKRTPYDLIHRLLMKDGRTKWVHERCRTEFDGAGRAVRSVGTVQDVTDRKTAEESLAAALAEKEVLLKELQHRIKNSMTMIISLIRLEEGRHEADRAARTALSDIRGRVSVLADLYGLLYEAGPAEVRLDSFCRRICDSLSASLAPAGAAEIALRLEEAAIPAGKASSVGLILNELLTNACKYAFPDGRHGRIEVVLVRRGQELELSVADDGIGLPAGFDMARSPGVGLTLVSLLAEQLGGTVRQAGAPGRGTTVSVSWH